MDEKDIAALQNAEIDYEDIIDRFEGNESLYLKLAELFLDDPHMPNVRRGVCRRRSGNRRGGGPRPQRRSRQPLAHQRAQAGEKHERRPQGRQRSRSNQAAAAAG